MRSYIDSTIIVQGQAAWRYPQNFLLRDRSTWRPIPVIATEANDWFLRHTLFSFFLTWIIDNENSVSRATEACHYAIIRLSNKEFRSDDDNENSFPKSCLGYCAWWRKVKCSLKRCRSLCQQNNEKTRRSNNIKTILSDYPLFSVGRNRISEIRFSCPHAVVRFYYLLSVVRLHAFHILW